MLGKTIRRLAVMAACTALIVADAPARAAIVPNTILGSGWGGTNVTTIRFVGSGCSGAFLSDPQNGLDALVFDAGPFAGRGFVNVNWKTPAPNPNGYLVASVYSGGCGPVGVPVMLLGESGGTGIPLPPGSRWLIVGSQGRVATTVTAS